MKIFTVILKLYRQQRREKRTRILAAGGRGVGVGNRLGTKTKSEHDTPEMHCTHQVIS